MNLYNQPRYYEIAFSFRNIPAEVDFFESAIHRFSKIKVRRVLELASGNSPYLEEWSRRGYSYAGLDKSKAMLSYVRKRAKHKDLQPQLVHGDMKSFSLPGNKYDIAYVLLGSLYVSSNREFVDHLRCVSAALHKGSLYLLDGVLNLKLSEKNSQKWTIRQKGVSIKTIYNTEVINPIEETYFEHLVLQIKEGGKTKTIKSKIQKKFFFPQEFLCIIQHQKFFEFIGWYNNFNFDEQPKPKGRSIIILRKR